MSSKKIFVISDTHFFHENIKKYENRPDNFNELIIENWNNTVGDDNLVIHLGDIYFGIARDWDKCITSLKGRKVLVKGGHDNNSYSWYLKKGFVFVCERFVLDIFGYNILFSHEPQLDLNGCDYNIHGHLHSLKTHNSEHYTDKHILFSLEKENYKPRLLRDFFYENSKRN